jgi:tetratricopeptide (TPR) repeat protein
MTVAWKSKPPVFRGRLLFAVALTAVLTVAHRALAQEDPASLLERPISQAESYLREGHSPEAEAAYHQALIEGWLLLGTLDRLDGRFDSAREAFVKASKEASGRRRAQQALALLAVQIDELENAEEILGKLAGEDPGDLEVAFALGRVYLAQRRPDLAEAELSRLRQARPIPPTHLVLGRTYRDFGDYEKARAEFRAALELDKAWPHAHYELGLTALRAEGRAGLEAAIPEFEAELTRDSADPRANLELGVALVETQRAAEAVAPLERALPTQASDPRAVAYLGRALYGSGRADEGVVRLREALVLGRKYGANAAALQAMHLHLGQALRRAGRDDEAKGEFAEAERLSVEGTQNEREQMARYMADSAQPDPGRKAEAPFLEMSPLAALAPEARASLRERARAALAGALLNLGVLEAQRQRFQEAGDWLAQAAELDPALPRVQESLAIAYFNSEQYARAIAPLEQARAANPDDPGLRRMLALARLNTHAFGEAAELLRDDQGRVSEPALQIAYASALVKSGHSAEAEPVLSALVARDGRKPELLVLLGQSHAQQGHFASAIAALEEALAQQPQVPEANATLGLIYLRQGRTAEAIQQLEIAVRLAPGDPSLHFQLAQAFERAGDAAQAARHREAFRRLNTP